MTNRLSCVIIFKIGIGPNRKKRRQLLKIKKGQRLRIEHRRKGTFTAIALRDFDSDEEAWFPVAPAEESVGGLGVLSGAWMPGEEIPCRASLARIIEIL